MQSEHESSKLLLDAVYLGDTARVRSLLDQGADPNAYVDRTVRLATAESVAADRLEDVTRRETALDLAARCGHRAVAELLLERGAHATAAALGHAVYAMDQELIRHLFGAGADPNALVWTTGEVPEPRDPVRGGYITVAVRAPVVTVASRLPDPAPFLLLVAAGGRAGQLEISSVLELALGSGDAAVVGPVVEAVERLGVTVDPIDVIGRQLAVVRFLLERRWQLHPESATPERRRAELTPLLMKAAFRHGCYEKERPWLRETAQFLIAQGADPDFFDPHGSGDRDISPLHEALRGLHEPHPWMVKLLLNHGARTTFVFANGGRETALDVAKRSLAPEFVPRMAVMLSSFGERQLQFPHGWIARAPALFKAVPAEARLEWIEQRVHASGAAPSRSYRFSFSQATSDEPILDRMKDAWARHGAKTFRGDASRRSAAGDGWTADVQTGRGAYLGSIVLPCDVEQAGRGLREVAAVVPVYRSLIQFADQRGAQLQMVYHTSFLPEPEKPGPKPILERADLLMVGNLELQDVEERLTALGYAVQGDDYWGLVNREERLQLWEQDGGIHATLNPDNHPGRML